jgi:hypothetical protein
MTESGLRNIAFLGSYVPRKCGIATFTADLRGAVATRYPQSERLVLPVTDIEESYPYEPVVRFEIEEQNRQEHATGLPKHARVLLRFASGVGKSSSLSGTPAETISAPYVRVPH